MSKIKLLSFHLVVLAILLSCGNEIMKRETQIAEVITRHTAEYDKYSKSQLIDDLDYFVATLEEVHPNLYFNIDQNDFYKAVEGVRGQLYDSMPLALFYKALAPLAAMIGDGHTFVNPVSIKSLMQREQVRVFPLAVEIRGGRIFNRESFDPEIPLNAGAEVLSIHGIPSEQIISALTKYFSAETPPFKEIRLQEVFFHYLWLEYGFTDHYPVVIRDGDVETEIVLNGVLIHNMGKVEVSHDKFYEYRFPDRQTCYLDFNSFEGLDQFALLLEQMFSEIEERGAENLVIDIRGNMGGNSLLGDLLFSYFYPGIFQTFSEISVKISEQVHQSDSFGGQMGEIVKFNGNQSSFAYSRIARDLNVILLTDRATFSSASGFASLIKDYGAGVIIGEETGGMGTCYGDLYWYTLPNTQIQGGISHKFFTRPSGNETVEGIMPDIEMDMYQQNGDPYEDSGLAAALELLQTNYDEVFSTLKKTAKLQDIPLGPEDRDRLIERVGVIIPSFMNSDIPEEDLFAVVEHFSPAEAEELGLELKRFIGGYRSAELIRGTIIPDQLDGNSGFLVLMNLTGDLGSRVVRIEFDHRFRILSLDFLPIS